MRQRVVHGHFCNVANQEHSPVHYDFMLFRRGLFPNEGCDRVSPLVAVVCTYA